MKNQNLPTIAYFIAIVVADFVGLGISVTVFPALILGGHWPGSQGISTSAQLVVLGLLLGMYPLGQFFGAAIFGKLSDMYGRKPLLVLTLIGNLLGFLVAAFAISSGRLILLFAGRLVAGVFAGNVAIAQAGMVDISDAEAKSGNLALLNGALGMSWIIGPPLGGVLSNSEFVSWFDFATPFWLESAVFAVMAMITLVAFTETLKTPTQTQSFDLANLGAGLEQVRQGFLDAQLRIFFAIWAIFVAGWWLFESYLPTYLLRSFHYSPDQIGAFLGFMGATFTVTSLFVVKPLAKKMEPQNMVMWFLGISGLSVFGIAIAQTSLELHLCIFGFVSSMGFALPGLVSAISNRGDSARQGEILGMISSIQALMTVVVMMAGGSLFAIHRNVTVVGGAALLLLSWAMFTLHFRKVATV